MSNANNRFVQVTCKPVISVINRLRPLTTMCTGGSPFSMLSGASRGEQKGSLTTGELSTFISASCSERSGSNPRGNSLGCSCCEPSSPAGGGMATEDRSVITEGSSSLAKKKLTSSGYIKDEKILG